MEKIGTYTFAAESYLTDFKGRVTLPMIGNYLIHAASDHAASRGFGFTDMTEQHTAWVLSRLAIEMNEYPKAFEKVCVSTWVDEVGRLFTSRCFKLSDPTGTRVYGYARSIWAAIDLKTRRPTLLDVEGLSRCSEPDYPCPIDKPAKISPIEQQAEAVDYKVKYSDLDINGHFNSIKYIEHMLDLFELSFFEEKEIRRFEIAYLQEGRYGMDLSLYKQEVADDKYTMAICHEDKAICRASVMWRG